MHARLRAHTYINVHVHRTVFAQPRTRLHMQNVRSMQTVLHGGPIASDNGAPPGVGRRLLLSDAHVTDFFKQNTSPPGGILFCYNLRLINRCLGGLVGMTLL